MQVSSKLLSTIFPFNSLSSNKSFLAYIFSTDTNITQRKDLENGHNSLISLKTSSNLELLAYQFNNATSGNSNDFGKMFSFKYYDFEEIHKIEIPHKNKLLSLFHVNACSL